MPCLGELLRQFDFLMVVVESDDVGMGLQVFPTLPHGENSTSPHTRRNYLFGFQLTKVI